MCAAEGLRYHPFHRRAQRHRRYEETIMLKLALFARLEAKPGKEREVADFLETGLALANEEATTPLWFALKLSERTFGVFDAFENEAGRQAHLQGPIAAALMAKAADLLSSPPSIEPIEILGFKNQARAT
jgi:quinol monooxygenase YgiN